MDSKTSEEKIRSSITLNNQFVRNYEKVSTEKRNKIIELVFQKGEKIKKAAQIVKIKYATAKNIIMKYRETTILKKPQNEGSKRRCRYRDIDLKKEQSKINFLCQFGGKTRNE